MAVAPAGTCLDDNDAAEFASGALTGAQATRVEGHLAGCRDCRGLVAALAGGHEDSEVATAPRPARLPRGKRRRDVGLEPTLPRGPTDEPEVAVGDTVGRYVVLSRLGAGGMGVVWSAYDPQLDRKVALKLLRAGTGLESSEGRTRLVREAQAIAQLSHPHVVAVYDVGTTEASGEVYIAMEFVEGETLTAWLTRWERPWREILDHFLQAGRGLAAAHGTGLLHRDFKPDNVLVGTEGRVRVTDFGLARSLITAAQEDNRGAPTAMMASLRATLTATGTVLGTPRYMAPEQLRGQDTDARSDQFSFCIALYEALYGRHPLPGTTAIQMVEDQARAIPPPDGPVPAFIGKALMRGLDAEPTRRFPSMHSLLHELTPPPSRTRERWLGAGLGAVLLVGGGAAAMVALSSAAPSSQNDQLIAELHKVHVEIDALRHERDRLLDIIKSGTPTTQQFQELQDKIAARDRQIEGLVQKIADLSTDAGAPGGAAAAQAAAAATTGARPDRAAGRGGPGAGRLRLLHLRVARARHRGGSPAGRVDDHRPRWPPVTGAAQRHRRRRARRLPQGSPRPGPVPAEPGRDLDPARDHHPRRHDRGRGRGPRHPAPGDDQPGGHRPALAHCGETTRPAMIHRTV